MPSLLRITVQVDAPVQAEDPIHLDALLESVFWRRHPRDSRRPTRTSRLRDDFVPHIGVGTVGGALRLCSGWLPEAPARPHMLTKRRDPEDYLHIARPVTPGSGLDRDMMERRMVHPVPAVTWLAWGQRQEIRRAMKCIPGVGGLRRQGLGSITEWSVEAIDGDPLRSIVDDEGHALRHIPASLCVETERTTWAAWRAPYWHAQRVAEVVPLGARCVLRSGLLETLTCR